MTSKNLKTGILSHFFIALVLDGLQRLTGLFMLELLQFEYANRQNAALPFIVSWAVANVVASLSGFLIPSKKSERAILFGILLTAIGAALCFTTTNKTILTVLWGFIFGSGYGISSPHLSRYLKSVNPTSSLLQATPNLGAAVMPFIFHMLVSYYGLQSSYLIFSGIILNYLPLSLAAAYNIELPIPNIKWRVRKRSRHYFVSKQEGAKTIFNESFINSLEPDLILTVSENGIYQGDVKTGVNGSEKLLKEITHVNRKRSETRGNDLQSLPINMRALTPKMRQSQISTDIKNYETGSRIFEESFGNSVIYEGVEIMEDNESKEQKGENNEYLTGSERDLEINDSNTMAETSIERNKNAEELNPENSYECVKRKSISKNKESVFICLEKNTKKTSSVDMQTDERQENGISQTDVEYKNDGHIAVNEVLERQHDKIAVTEEHCENSVDKDEDLSAVEETLEKQNDKEISVTSEHSAKPSPVLNSPVSKNLKLESKLLDNKAVINIPMDIKVHVVECFMTDGEYWKANKQSKGKKHSYRAHSNSMLPGTYDNIDLTQLDYSKTTKKNVKQGNTKLTSVYTISENSEFDGQSRTFMKAKEKEQKRDNYTMEKIKPVFKFLNEITAPICLYITLITIIFEFNIVTLLLIFADFGRDIGDNYSDFKYILISFGLGGLMGKICCCKISRTIPEKSHTIGVILFLLTGLSTAGILFSPNLYWLAGFYCILGALEGGITYTIPKFISEHIDKSLHTKLSSVKCFLSGIAIVSIPYAIGLSRDDLNDYEFLLQILSCSSVFCALLTYFLPHMSKTFK